MSELLAHEHATVAVTRHGKARAMAEFAITCAIDGGHVLYATPHDTWQDLVQMAREAQPTCYVSGFDAVIEFATGGTIRLPLEFDRRS